jgi:hypothetical protein
MILADCHDYAAGCHPHHGGMTIAPTHHFHQFASHSADGGTGFAVLVVIFAVALLWRLSKS